MIVRLTPSPSKFRGWAERDPGGSPWPTIERPGLSVDFVKWPFCAGDYLFLFFHNYGLTKWMFMPMTCLSESLFTAPYYLKNILIFSAIYFPFWFYPLFYGVLFLSIVYLLQNYKRPQEPLTCGIFGQISVFEASALSACLRVLEVTFEWILNVTLVVPYEAFAIVIVHCLANPLFRTVDLDQVNHIFSAWPQRDFHIYLSVQMSTGDQGTSSWPLKPMPCFL